MLDDVIYERRRSEPCAGARTCCAIYACPPPTGGHIACPPCPVPRFNRHIAAHHFFLRSDTVADDETLRTWKRNARDAHAASPEKTTPVNPAGSDELTEADLDAVAGGAHAPPIDVTEMCVTLPLCVPPDVA